MFDLPVQTRLGQLLFILKMLFTFVTKQATLNEGLNCTESFLSVSVPCMKEESRTTRQKLSMKQTIGVIVCENCATGKVNTFPLLSNFLAFLFAFLVLPSVG